MFLKQKLMSSNRQPPTLSLQQAKTVQTAFSLTATAVLTTKATTTTTAAAAATAATITTKTTTATDSEQINETERVLLKIWRCPKKAQNEK